MLKAEQVSSGADRRGSLAAAAFAFVGTCVLRRTRAECDGDLPRHARGACRAGLWGWLLPAILAAPCAGQAWTTPEIRLPSGAKHPVIACTAPELQRLRAAYRGAGPEHDAVAGAVRHAERFVGQPVAFPPRGGQHNQWYQCDKCQVGLKTVDDAHHRCPQCRTVYSGEPYDDVIFERKHEDNLHRMLRAAWAYALTGEPKFAQYARSVLLGYAERYAAYPYHGSDRRIGPWSLISGGRLFEQTLNEAYALAERIAPAYDLIYESPLLAPADHEKIRTGLLLPMLKNIDKHKAGKGNWQTWHNAGMLWAAPLVGDDAWARKAIADPANGFAYQMEVSVSADGMWYENSWGYHFYTLHAMVLIVEGARRLGIDLWGHPALKKMFTLPVDYAMPNGSLPRFGDDVNATIGSAASFLEYAYNAYRDPAMLPYLAARPTWESVLFGRPTGARGAPPAPAVSKVLDATGHAILRTRGEAGLAAVLTYGPYGGYHGHLDKLSFVFFGYQQELGVDPGRAASQAYRLPVHKQWYKPTISHNTVLVDGAPQKPAAGKLEAFSASPDYAAVLARCDAAYPGVSHRRLLCLASSYLLVFDELESKAPRRFDWLYHHRGSAVACDAASKDDTLGKEVAGGEYVRNVKSGATSEPVAVRFEGPALTTHLVFDAAPGTEVRTGDGVGASMADRVPMVAVTRRGTRARFAAVLEPVPKGKAPTVASVAIDSAEGQTRITVRRGAGTDVIHIAPGSVRVPRAGAP